MSRAIGQSGPPLRKTFREPRAPKGLRKENPERRAKAYARGFGEHGDFIRTLPCVIKSVHPRLRTECYGPTEAAHLHHRGMGGAKGDWRSLFPACSKHHGEHDRSTAKFQARYDIDLSLLVEHLILRDPQVTAEDKEAARVRLAKLREPR